MMERIKVTFGIYLMCPRFWVYFLNVEYSKIVTRKYIQTEEGSCSKLGLEALTDGAK
jgi:hypothetical protein